MEQGTASQPNPASLDRLTGKAVFFPTGSAGGTDLGVIVMHKLDLGIEREKFRRPVSRSVLMDSEDVVAVAPVFALEGQQFHTAIIPLLLLGRRDPNFAQSAITARTVTLTARLDQVFELGAISLSNFSVKRLGVTMTAGVDYFLEPSRGLLRFPSAAAGIMEGDIVVVQFDALSLLYESYTAFDVLARDGTLKLWEMDRSPIVKNGWIMPGTLTAETFGDGDPTKFRKWKLRFSLSGQAQVLRRITTATPAAAAVLGNVLTLDDGTPVTLADGSYVDVT